MEHVPVNSSNIQSIAYDSTTAVLEVAFHSGRVYQYFNVPINIHRQFLEANSKGQFFNSNIRNKYGDTRVR